MLALLTWKQTMRVQDHVTAVVPGLSGNAVMEGRAMMRESLHSKGWIAVGLLIGVWLLMPCVGVQAEEILATPATVQTIGEYGMVPYPLSPAATATRRDIGEYARVPSPMSPATVTTRRDIGEYARIPNPASPVPLSTSAVGEYAMGGK